MDKSKILVAAIAVMLLGLVAALVGTNMSPSKDASQETMFEQLEFNGKAREACVDAIKNNSKYDLGGLMFDSQSDGHLKATFTWKGEGKVGSKSTWALKDNTFEKLDCNFEKGKGVVTLVADSKVVWSSGGTP
jgi:type II secretory pathway pseudopilin PulG